MDPSACKERGKREWYEARERERINVVSCFPVCSKEEWDKIIASIGKDRIQLRDERYDQVIHLMTAANGAEPFYQLSNNSTRMENIEQAIERDQKGS